MKHYVINGPQCWVLAVLVYKWQARDDIYGENDDRKMERCRKNSESVVLAARRTVLQNKSSNIITGHDPGNPSPAAWRDGSISNK